MVYHICTTSPDLFLRRSGWTKAHSSHGPNTPELRSTPGGECQFIWYWDWKGYQCHSCAWFLAAREWCPVTFSEAFFLSSEISILKFNGPDFLIRGFFSTLTSSISPSVSCSPLLMSLLMVEKSSHCVMTTSSSSGEDCPIKTSLLFERLVYRTEWKLRTSMQALALSPVPPALYQTCSCFESPHFAAQTRLGKSELVHDPWIK